MEDVIPGFVLTKQNPYNDVRTFGVTFAASAEKFSLLKKVIHAFTTAYWKYITFAAEVRFVAECNAEQLSFLVYCL